MAWSAPLGVSCEDSVKVPVTKPFVRQIPPPRRKGHTLGHLVHYRGHRNPLCSKNRRPLSDLTNRASEQIHSIRRRVKWRPEAVNGKSLRSGKLRGALPDWTNQTAQPNLPTLPRVRI